MMSKKEWGVCECGRQMTGFTKLYCPTCDVASATKEENCNITGDITGNQIILFGPDPSLYGIGISDGSTDYLPAVPRTVAFKSFCSTFAQAQDWVNKNNWGSVWKYLIDVKNAGTDIDVAIGATRVRLNEGNIISGEEI